MNFTKLVRPKPDGGDPTIERSRLQKLQYGELEKEGATLQKCFTYSPGESNMIKAKVIQLSGHPQPGGPSSGSGGKAIHPLVADPGDGIQ
jgi:hypothetical protein